ncbi:MAG TPA: molybdopterin-dependent oxidoreductase [Micromonosporaceae bacterium]|nr:molybdopterin-dependent oxidoreductase [Micromonosporaceae bacterium]
MGEREVVGACPLDCPDTCSWIVTVRDGVPVKLRGNPEHPFTRGSLCVKVNQYLDHTAAPDRLLHPLRRVGRKGQGSFERISWDDALSEIAKRLTGIIGEYGGQAIWPYQGTGTLGYLQGLHGRAGSRLWNVLGTSRHKMTICASAGSAGMSYATGTNTGIDPESLRHARLILLWGANTLTTSHHLWRFVEAARRDGGYVVAVDPVLTRTARQADEHVAPLPGTDTALALGLLNVVLGLGCEDTDYLSRHTLGWQKFRERIMEFPPDRVATITGLDVAQIVQLGERLARTRPTAIRVGIGVQHHASGGDVLRTLACVPGVTGDWQYPGGGLTFSTAGHFGTNRDALYRDDLLDGTVRTLPMTRLGEGLLDLTDPPVKALIVYGANPMASTPHQGRIRRGLARDDLFTVVIEHFPTDTVDYADIVLPATMQTEHLDVHDAWGHCHIAWNEPAVQPPGECLPHTEIFRRLASTMGLTEPSLYDSDEQLANQVLDTKDPSLDGITVEKLRSTGWARLNFPPDSALFRDGFPTPSGKLEFFSARAAEDGLDPMPGYTPPKEISDGSVASRYPLVLIAGASRFFLNSTFANRPQLARRAGQPQVVMNPADASQRGIADGERVRVFNDRGAFTATAKVADLVRPAVVATTKGHWLKVIKGPNLNATVDERDADMGNGAVFHDNRVEIELVTDTE